MKDLIVIPTYCPDNHRKEVLHTLIQNLQKVRSNYDIMVVSHSPISELSTSYVDYVYIDNENLLLKDYDLTNKFWFNNDKFTVNSSLIYTSSTHYAIYGLIHYIINFSRFKGYEKIHYIEYDVTLNTDIIDKVNEKLDIHDNVIFGQENSLGLSMESGYFAFKPKNFPEQYFSHNKEFILNEIKSINNRMTEDYTLKFLSVNDRSTYRFNEVPFTRTINSHENGELMWCVPINIKDTNKLCLFVFNELGGEYDIIVSCDGNNHTLRNVKKGSWSITDLGDINTIKNIKIIVNGHLKRDVNIDDLNIDSFKFNNYLKYK